MLDTIRKYFSIKILLSAVLLALVTFGILAALLLGSKPTNRQEGSATAIVNIIPAPTWTPALPPPTQVPTVTSTPNGSQPLGEIEVDAYVQVSGTGGTGFRLRVEHSA